MKFIKAAAALIMISDHSLGYANADQVFLNDGTDGDANGTNGDTLLIQNPDGQADDALIMPYADGDLEPRDLQSQHPRQLQASGMKEINLNRSSANANSGAGNPARNVF